MTNQQQKITIYLSNAKKLKCNSTDEFEDCLIMRPDTGDLFINDLTTISEEGGGSEIKWKLDNNSGISEISEIKEKERVKLFKNEPEPDGKGGMVAELVENNTGENGPIIEGAYYIKYKRDDIKEMPVEIDPFIRIPPSKTING